MARAGPSIVVAFLVLTVGWAAAQGGEGLGVSPPRIDLADAQPGQTYLRTVQVQNPSDTPSGIGIQRSGDAASWTSSDPASNFTIAAHGVRDVALSIAVPDSAGPGAHSGQLTFIADPKAGPGGSGSAVRPAIGLLLNVTVGGTATIRFTWLSARVEDAAVGTAVQSFVSVRNDGNVRATAQASGSVLAFAADTILANATGSLPLQPGETGEVPVTFTAGLAAGQYRARLRSPPADGFEEIHAFKVTPGGLAPDGILRAITHVAYGTAGRPVRFDAWFQNTGNVTIQSAAFHGEVRRGEVLLATLDSESLVVAPRQSVNLTTYWTPTGAGTFAVVGHVTYDGFQTLPSESPLNVRAGVAGFPWWILVLLVALAVGLLVWAYLKRRRDRRRPPGPARPPSARRPS